jgi:hypothetical protein
VIERSVGFSGVIANCRQFRISGDFMKSICLPIIATAAAILLSSCVDRSGDPLLLPVGMPAQPAAVVHPLCVGDANASYNRARQEFEKRERLSNIYVQSAGDDVQEERQANARARMTYISCAASQGYKAVY